VARTQPEKDGRLRGALEDAKGGAAVHLRPSRRKERIQPFFSGNSANAQFSNPFQLRCPDSGAGCLPSGPAPAGHHSLRRLSCDVRHWTLVHRPLACGAPADGQGKNREFPVAVEKRFCFPPPLGYIACETGWIAAEVGRQPWVVYRVLKTSQSVSPAVSGRPDRRNPFPVSHHLWDAFFRFFESFPQIRPDGAGPDPDGRILGAANGGNRFFSAGLVLSDRRTPGCLFTAGRIRSGNRHSFPFPGPGYRGKADVDEPDRPLLGRQ